MAGEFTQQKFAFEQQAQIANAYAEEKKDLAFSRRNGFEPNHFTIVDSNDTTD